MPDEAGNFQTTGPTWQERAQNVPGIAAVYSPNNPVHSRWLDLIYDRCFHIASHYFDEQSTVLDFGCGIGHRTLMLSQRAQQVIGVEITTGMIQRTHELCQNTHVVLSLIDGVHIPLANASVDLIWVSAVLRYSLLVSDPKHRDIVSEFSRVLNPGGFVCNLEMYVSQPSDVFSKDFLQIGFLLKKLLIPHVYTSKFDRWALGNRRKLFLNAWWAAVSCQWTRVIASEERLGSRLRDYFFIYQKSLSLS